MDVIYKQQNIIKDYQDQIAKLKDENQSLEQNFEKIIHQEDHKDKMEDMGRKIKYYQDDNLRLSNELVQLSKKREEYEKKLKVYLLPKDGLDGVISLYYWRSVFINIPNRHFGCVTKGSRCKKGV